MEMNANILCSFPVQVEMDPSDEDKITEGAENQEQVDSDDIGSASSESSSIQGLDDPMFSPAEILNMTMDSFQSCIEVSWGKRLAILDSGFIGIVPGESDIGDALYIFMGCSLPLVIRRGNSSHHRLVGESYFHGVTEGELMDGNPKSLENITFE
jgi:hypothetical protein